MFPEYEEWIRIYYSQWEDMLGDAIQETVEILKNLLNTQNIK